MVIVIGTAIVALLGPAGTASAAGPAAYGIASAGSGSVAETRVRAFEVAAAESVGPTSGVSAGQRLGNGPSGAQIASAAGVAAKTAGGAIPKPTAGMKIYRVYGGDSTAGGASWYAGRIREVRPITETLPACPSGGASGATNTGQLERRQLKLT